MARRWLASLCCLSLLLTVVPRADAAPEHPRLTRVWLAPGQTVNTLLEAGLDVLPPDGAGYLVLEWPRDQATLASLGVRTEVVDEDPGRTAAERARAELASRPRPPGQRVMSATRPDGVFRAAVLPPFGSGSMGGYWTLDEVKMKLDLLVASDLSDLVANKLDTLGTSIEGRPIWGLKLGKSVPNPDTRPVAFFNALTHAREPEGMQALFYFVDDLLSKYGTDPMASYLLDQRAIYIVPVVNPDGYRYNQTTNPGGGGLWRKNRRDNPGNNEGVDLNRNYGYQWGLNEGGSSGDPASELYRGTGPFSEPETQTQRDIVAALQPKTGISFHTYSDLLLHPWGYTETAPEDSAAFYEWDDDMSAGNGYQTGQAIRVLYAVNGEFNDWCYGDTQLKPRAFTWTPEVGSPNDGFWPAPSRIVPLAQENLRTCYYAAAIAGPHVRVESFTIAEGNLNAGTTAHLLVRARNRGVSGSAGPGLSAALASLSAGANVHQNTGTFPTLASLQSGDMLGGASFVISANDTVTPGRPLRFQVSFTAPDGFFSRDTIEVVCGTPTVLFADNASAGMVNWSTATWDIESSDALHPGPYFADSPDGRYDLLANNIMTRIGTLSLTPGVHAYVLYEARWDFQSDVDFGAIEASPNGTTWTPLPTASTTPGLGLANSTQPLGQPIYDGTRHYWKQERADLAGFVGNSAVRLRFRVRSNSDKHADGLNIDSVRVVVYDPAAQPAPVAVGDGPAPVALELARLAPNPVRGIARFEFAVPGASRVRLDVFDVTGRRVCTLADGTLPAGRYVRGWDLRDDQGRAVASGVYLARLSGATGSASQRFVVLR